MPIAPVDRKILIIASGVFFIMTGAATLSIRGTDSSENVPSVYSAASGGCKAAYLLLQESGYQVQTWEQRLADLSTEGKGKTLIIVEPAAFPASEERQKLESFLKSGGRLIAAGRFASFYLPTNEAVSDPLNGTMWRHFSAISLSPITRAAPEITLASRAYWKPGTGAVGLYGEPEKPVVVEYKVGAGRVLWLSASTPMTNSGIRELGNLEFLLTALGGPEQNQILWDEYIHGHERFAATRKSKGMIGWMGLQLAVFTAAILIAYSRRSGPIWIPEGEVRLSPLEYVRTLGMLYELANAGSVAVEISCQRFRHLLTRRLGLSITSSVSDLALAVHERRGMPEQEFADTLSECESYRYDPKVSAKTALRLVQTLFDYAVRLRLVQTPQGETTAWKQS
jgi:hypothetical protein